MKSISIRLLITLFLVAAMIPAIAEGNWVEESNANTLMVMEAQAQMAPENFSSLGIESVDAEVMDLGPNLYERSQASSRELIATLEERKKTTENPRVLQDLDILIKSLNDQVRTNELQHKYMLPYYNLSQSLYFGFRSLLDPRNDPARFPAALERLKKYTGQADGHQPLTDLARQRSSERFAVPGLLGPYQGELEKDLGNVEQFKAGLNKVFTESALEGWEEDLALLTGQLDTYAEWVKQEIVPRGRDDYRLPEEIYADNLKNFGVDMDPHQLIRMAQLGFADLQMQMQSISAGIAKERGWKSADYRDVMAELGKERIPEAEVLDYYRNILKELETIIRDNELVTLPDREAAIRLATEAESAAAPVPFLSPPQLIGNTGQQGEFVLVTHSPNEEDGGEVSDFGSPASTWSLTAHEARPGHEMQFASMVENGISQARVIYAFNSANVEGWGLYSEAIMQQYLSPEAQLFGLKARLIRAARAFLDPMLNLGLIGKEEALELITRDVGLSKALANQEINRYTFRAPGQATSYYYGYMNLMSLRAEVELRMRDRFNQRAYHDFLLKQGLLPPDILRQAVLTEFVTQ
jgi:hypothetical protein